ncbi:MAG: hypothetical protein ACE5DW_04475 [Thermodesulfobacteriota bacterium]
MMKKVTTLFVSLTILSMLGAPSGAFARRFQILDEVELIEDNGCRFIEVGFNIPMRYIKHFPYQSGEDLRIKLETLNIHPTDRSAQFQREYPGSLSNELSELADVVFEGEVEGGPFLAIFFHNTQNFKVAQGNNFRSLVIALSEEGEPPCEPTR